MRNTPTGSTSQNLTPRNWMKNDEDASKKDGGNLPPYMEQVWENRDEV